MEEKILSGKEIGSRNYSVLLLFYFTIVIMKIRCHAESSYWIRDERMMKMKKSLLIWGVLLILLISLTGCGTPSNTNQASQENINKIAEQNETILNQQKELKENMLTNTNLLLQQLTQADADEMYVSFANELVSILTEDEKYVIDTGTVLSYKEKDGGFVYEIQFASEKKELKVTIDGLSIYMCEARNDSHTSYYKLTDKNGSTYYDRIVGAKVIAIADLNNTLKMLVEVHQE